MSEDRAILITGGTFVPMIGSESGAADVLVAGQATRLAPGTFAGIAVPGCECRVAEPLADPADVVVFGLGVKSVRHLMVDGTVVEENSRLRSGDSARIRGRARVAGAAVARRLGWS